MDFHELGEKLRKKNPGMKILESRKMAQRMLAEWEAAGVGAVPREPGCGDSRSSKASPIGEALPGVVEQAKKTPAEVFHPEGGDEEFPFGKGPRAKRKKPRKPGPAKAGEVKGRNNKPPTNSERMNRGLVELSPMAYKVMTLYWKWSGAPAKGGWLFRTIKSVARFCGTTRPGVRRAEVELLRLGWIELKPYDKHWKNSLVRLIPIRKVPPPGDPPKEVRS